LFYNDVFLPKGTHIAKLNVAPSMVSWSVTYSFYTLCSPVHKK